MIVSFQFIWESLLISTLCGAKYANGTDQRRAKSAVNDENFVPEFCRTRGRAGLPPIR